MNRILIVDDERNIRFLYQQELKQSGYLVDTAADGNEALEKVSKNIFSLVIIDIEMSDMSGIELLGKIRELSPETLLILNSAYSTYKADFKTWLADAYLVKSSDLELLKKKIRELLERYEVRK